jgi:hypothetical protein
VEDQGQGQTEDGDKLIFARVAKPGGPGVVGGHNRPKIGYPNIRQAANNKIDSVAQAGKIHR